ncbi:cbr-clec-223 protein [Colletotrichum asianum]
MAHLSFHRGGHHPNRRHQSAGGYDRYGRGSLNRQRDLQIPVGGSQVPLSYHPGPPSQLQGRLYYPVGDFAGFEYPYGVRSSYPMVTSHDGFPPKLYTENHLPKSFYTANKPGRAIFSTNGGNIQPHCIAPSDFDSDRKLPLWSAEEIQKNANSIRKKFWEHMKDMAEPVYWEDMCDYFDCSDIYYHGALNIFNLLYHLWHENQDLKKEAYRVIALEVGIWCDRWLDRGNNKQRLLDFQNWDNINSLFSADDQVGNLDASQIEIMKNALRHRHDQLRHNLVPSPTSYPCNQMGVHGARIQDWLYDQPIADSHNGLHTHLTMSNPRPVGQNSLDSIPEHPQPPRGYQTPVVAIGTSSNHVVSQPPSQPQSRPQPTPASTQEEEPKGWERIPGRDEEIHGPVHRRSPTKRDSRKDSTRIVSPDQPSQSKSMEPSPEAETQSKPPSEEVLPDEASGDVETTQSMRSRGKTITVNLPTTPKKEKPQTTPKKKDPQGSGPSTPQAKVASPPAVQSAKKTSSPVSNSSEAKTAPPSSTPKQLEKTFPSPTTTKSSSKTSTPYSQVYNDNNANNVELVEYPERSHPTATKTQEDMQKEIAGRKLDSIFDTMASSNQKASSTAEQPLTTVEDTDPKPKPKSKSKKKKNKKKKAAVVPTTPPPTTFTIDEDEDVITLTQNYKKEDAPKTLTEYLGRGLRSIDDCEPAVQAGHVSTVEDHHPKQDTPPTDRPATPPATTLMINEDEDIITLTQNYKKEDAPKTLTEYLARGLRSIENYEPAEVKRVSTIDHHPKQDTTQTSMEHLAEDLASIKITQPAQNDEPDASDAQTEPTGDSAKPVRKGFRAGAGGSLRLSKTRSQNVKNLSFVGQMEAAHGSNQPLDPAPLTNASCSTANDGNSSNASQGNVLTPATPLSARETMLKEKTAMGTSLKESPFKETLSKETSPKENSSKGTSPKETSA